MSYIISLPYLAEKLLGSIFIVVFKKSFYELNYFNLDLMRIKSILKYNFLERQGMSFLLALKFNKNLKVFI
ncbi:MAG TPA: hypothetical protein DIT85_04805 [Pantoea ananatis]|nr:hypothetical protein L585_01505 [Pantoea ananatis BRT175]PQK89423.1 hypothetical protein CG432_12095 [Pantoea ananatis]HCN00183.1 hypothetical protein [Pantoea ananatis]HCP25786.1 hypothetical protein [Pantoea ananatis]